MSAQIYILPVVRRVHPEDPAWCEQLHRESWARVHDGMAAPLRTRPLVAVDNARAAVEFEATMVHVFAAMACEPLIVGDRPEGK